MIIEGKRYWTGKELPPVLRKETLNEAPASARNKQTMAEKLKRMSERLGGR